MPTTQDHDVPADRTRHLVGRAAEVRAWDRALARLRSGRGRTIALAGEPGIGKSALIIHLAARARASGVPVLNPVFDDGPNPATGFERQWTPAASGNALVVVADELHRIDPAQLPAVERLIRSAADAPMLLLLAYRRRQLAPRSPRPSPVRWPRIWPTCGNWGRCPATRPANSSATGRTWTPSTRRPTATRSTSES
ncbi:ATP-binding protein [Catenulispora yoronensis]